ncbi:class I SAM-dependent methyltransferase [Streptomyces antimicrobicus]|uniref:Methyltransferase domain-containing protein n=1 Tax=Streptomyces antimicrobicus TaxID=2883108 RepID=A0ABS8B7G6_9ACTN|nr:class I SAM-dependent methyltransferase [Streptomyces antimicrobicus]MCB5180558.1 methyltransferase domain-containing protein [Streptomyces antimicrobicus]
MRCRRPSRTLRPDRRTHGGVDLSPMHVALARQRCGPRVDIHQAEAVAWLDAADETYDVVLSVFGAHWFTDPELLLPAIRRKPGRDGVVILARASPQSGLAQPDGRWLSAPREPPARTVLRWEGEACQWAAALIEAGFHDVSSRTVVAPSPDRVDTVLIRARGQ